MGTVNPDVDAVKKRSQVVQWLNTLFPDFNLSLDASDEDLRAQMLNGVVLCAIRDKKLGSIQSQRGVFISIEQRLYNLKRFLSAMDEIGLLRFNTSDLEQGSMCVVVDCLLSLRDHMSSGIGDDVLYDATKYRSQPRKKWIISGGDNMISMDVSQGNHKGSEPSSPLSARSSSELKSQNVLRNPIVPEPSTTLLHPVGHKFPEIFQLQQGRYSDIPAAKISEMMKSNSLDNAPTQSLLSVVNGILDESIERKNGEIPHRIVCLLRKVVQEIERRILTQADHIRSQNNLIKAREEKYQSRIRVLETLASGTSEETQMVSNQLQKIKVHTKKRNRLSHRKLHNLVYVKFNARLKNKLAIKDRDPLAAYDEEEKVTEWLVHQNNINATHIESDDEVFPGEPLTWRQVAKVMGANPKRRKSSRTTKKGAKKTRGEASSSQSKRVERNDDEVHEEDEDTLESSSDEEEPNIPIDDDDVSSSDEESEHGEEE